MALLLVAILSTLAGSRQQAVRAVLLLGTLVPLGQQIRCFRPALSLLLRYDPQLALVRVLIRGEITGFRRDLDWIKLFFAYAVVGFVCGVLLGQFISHGAAIGNMLGAYFVMRFLMLDLSDLVGHPPLFGAAGVCHRRLHVCRA